jgi:hypothetical protein
MTHDSSGLAWRPLTTMQGLSRGFLNPGYACLLSASLFPDITSNLSPSHYSQTLHSTFHLVINKLVRSMAHIHSQSESLPSHFLCLFLCALFHVIFEGPCTMGTQEWSLIFNTILLAVHIAFTDYQHTSRTESQ